MRSEGRRFYLGTRRPHINRSRAAPPDSTLSGTWPSVLPVRMSASVSPGSRILSQPQPHAVSCRVRWTARRAAPASYECTPPTAREDCHERRRREAVRSRSRRRHRARRHRRRRHAAGPCRRRGRAAGAPRRRAVRRRRPLHALSRPARRGPHGRRHRALPLAPCLLQPAHGRGGARARLRSAAALARPAPGRQGLRARQAAGRGREAGARRSRARRLARLGRHRRRRRRRLRRRRDAAPRGLRPPGHPAQRRRRPALRPPEPVEGLSRRHGEGVVDSAEVAEVLREARDRPAPERARRPRSTRATAASPSPTARRSTTARSCSPPAPIRCASTCPAPMPSAVHYLRTLADSRAIVAAAATAKTRAGDRRQLHRPGGRGLAARPQARRPCRRPRGAAAGARHGAGARRRRAPPAREAGRRLPSRPDRDEARGQDGDA